MEKKTWQQRFEEVGAFWKHDGNPKRPYARLTGDKPRMSNVYFDSSKVVYPWMLTSIVEELFLKAPGTLTGVPLRKRPEVVVGAALGSVFFVYEVARKLSAYAWFTEPTPEGQRLRRFTRLRSMKHAVAVEDTITTGGSVIECIRETEAAGLEVLPFVLCIVNRSGRATLPDGRGIYALVEIKDAQVWEEGHNPFTPDGKELVPPLRPKKGNWKKLTKKYD